MPGQKKGGAQGKKARERASGRANRGPAPQSTVNPTLKKRKGEGGKMGKCCLQSNRAENGINKGGSPQGKTMDPDQGGTQRRKRPEEKNNREPTTEEKKEKSIARGPHVGPQSTPEESADDTGGRKPKETGVRPRKKKTGRESRARIPRHGPGPPGQHC